MTPTVKSGIAAANFAMTDWESFGIEEFGLCDTGGVRDRGARRSVSGVDTSEELSTTLVIRTSS
jgi:hypothetical protein